jgi:hypothetical protein
VKGRRRKVRGVVGDGGSLTFSRIVQLDVGLKVGFSHFFLNFFFFQEFTNLFFGASQLLTGGMAVCPGMIFVHSTASHAG